MANKDDAPSADPKTAPKPEPERAASGVKTRQFDPTVVGYAVHEDPAATEDAMGELPEADENGNIAVHCLLPSGLVLAVHGRDDVKVGNGVTPVKRDQAAAWLAQNREYEPLKRGMISFGDLRKNVDVTAAPYAGPVTEGHAEAVAKAANPDNAEKA